MTKKKTKQKDEGEPVFSPDGRYLYYSRDVSPGETFRYGKNSAECFAPEGLRKYINSHQSDAANPDMSATSSDQA